MIEQHSKPPLLTLTDIQAAATTDQLIVLMTPPSTNLPAALHQAKIIHVTAGYNGMIDHDDTLNDFLYEILVFST